MVYPSNRPRNRRLRCRFASLPSVEGRASRPASMGSSTNTTPRACWWMVPAITCFAWRPSWALAVSGKYGWVLRDSRGTLAPRATRSARRRLSKGAGLEESTARATRLERAVVVRSRGRFGPARVGLEAAQGAVSVGESSCRASAVRGW